MLLVASCYFYMVFKPVYILIIFATIIIDYFAGLWIERSSGPKRKTLLILSLISNIGFLSYFKYFNFFNANLTLLLNHFGMENPFHDFKGELPIGLSFHTFQAMAYTIEVYRRKQTAEKDFSIYSLYVLFYPQLVAGPIERPQNILPQMHEKKAYDFENIKDGLMRIAWGLFKKVVIADRLALYVDPIYNNPTDHNPLTLLIATFFYTFQIYCDFSGYSDIAIGCAKVMGFKFMENFNAPYFSKSIAEFWSRWHISLSTWFRDYLYIPMGGNRVSELRNYFNLFFVFLLSGLWHGASWNFVIWGAIHGFLMIFQRFGERHFKKKLSASFLANTFKLVITFVMVMLAWIFFRAAGLTKALFILKSILSFRFSGGYQMLSFNKNEFLFCFGLIAFLLLKDRFIMHIKTKNTYLFFPVLILIFALTYFFGIFDSNQFIYFQF